MLKSPTMPEKSILFQVGTSGNWSTWSDKPGGHRLGGVRCEGWMDLGKQDLPTGRPRNQTTSDTASDVSHTEYCLLTQLPVQRGDHAEK